MAAPALYRLHRATIRDDLPMSTVLAHLGVPDVSSEEIDQALDEA